jgi:hypothetical protein
MKYISKYSNGKEVTAAQYITELICENKAKRTKKDLHYKFWTTKEWSLYYRNQISTANKLVKQYNEAAIIRALKSSDGQNIYSLRAPFLMPLILKAEEAIANENKTLTNSYDRSEQKTFQTQSNKKSIISKLRKLE